MTTDGGGWTLILRDSWKDKKVECGKSCNWLHQESSEFSVGTADDTKDYLGPHLFGTVKDPTQLQPTLMLCIQLTSK